MIDFALFMKNQYSSTTLTINLAAIAENYRALKNNCAKNCVVSAVVKADAYGLGVLEVASALENAGCSTFFVANLDEGVELRNILPQVKIYVLHGLVAGQEDVFVKHNLTPVLNSIQQVNLWLQHSEKMQEKLSCVLHFDTGMNRLGIKGKGKREGEGGEGIRGKGEGQWVINNEQKKKKDYSPFPFSLLLSPLTSHSSLNIEYIMSHLACADEENHPMNSQQLVEFQNVAGNFEGIKLSLANSSGIFLGQKYHFDMVRPGVALYGANPTPYTKNPMKNVVTLTSKILQIELVDRAGAVGYGASYKLHHGTKIATIAVGYADGYLRSLSNQGICAIDGVIVPVIGRVSMDLVTVDVTKIPDEKLYVGAEVELIGENIPVDVVAGRAGTIGYEILTSLGARYRRRFKV